LNELSWVEMLWVWAVGSFWLKMSSSFDWLLSKFGFSVLVAEKAEFYSCWEFCKFSYCYNSLLVVEDGLSFTNYSIGFRNKEYKDWSCLKKFCIKINFTYEHCQNYHHHLHFNRYQTLRILRDHNLFQNNQSKAWWYINEVVYFFV